jgi:hypothetical protein
MKSRREGEEEREKSPPARRSPGSLVTRGGEAVRTDCASPKSLYLQRERAQANLDAAKRLVSVCALNPKLHPNP